jgi:osmoprotectant transport system permease protein
LELIHFVLSNLGLIGARTLQHLALVGTALGIALATGVPLGIAITLNARAAATVLYVAGIVITIPSVALFGLLIPLLSPFGQGIGFVPAVVALILYSQLPIIRNTYTAIINVDPALREAARGMGMTVTQRLWNVELPLALPVILSGVRNAAALTIGIAAIATYIGAGGLGTFISRGIASTDVDQLLTGAITISALAIVVDLTLLFVQRRITSPGLRQ